MINGRKHSSKFFILPVFIIVCLSVGWLGSASVASSRDIWYQFLRKPYLNPPNWVFAPVWTLLYIAMATAAWLVWNKSDAARNRRRFLFVLQLGLNGAWSFLFFGLRSPLLGLIDIILLWLVLTVLICHLWGKERSSAILLIPYLLWVSFASYLNMGFLWLNSSF